MKMRGWRARIGLIVPSSNTTMEAEFWTHAPEGVSIHTSRLPLRKVMEKELVDMANEVEKCAELLFDTKVDIIIYGCTTGSLIKGKGYDEEIERRINKVTGIPVVATARAVLDVLNEKGVKKIAVATPYIEEINQKEKDFLTENGFEVCGIKGLGIEENIEIGKQPPEVAYNLGKEIIRSHPEAEALFISCTNFRTFEIITALCQDIRKPVVSSNQASLWIALRECGLSWEFVERI